MNGKSVEVDNTDAEGRLILAGTLAMSGSGITTDMLSILDAVYYTATEHNPHTLIDVATLTG